MYIGFRLNADDEKAKIEQVDSISFDTLKKTLKEKNKYLKFTMVKRFDRLFTKGKVFLFVFVCSLFYFIFNYFIRFKIQMRMDYHVDGNQKIMLKNFS
jgi:hypothetical protein